MPAPDPSPFEHLITSRDALRALVPEPSALVVNKVVDHLDRHAKAFLEMSPYVVLASSDAAGRCDSSPRGGAPGFIRVVDDRHLFIPEVTGNRRNDTLLNVMERPAIGLLAMIPGLDETLRINGRAWVVADPALLAACAHAGKVPVVGLGIRVEECYLHCAKSGRRSALWNPDAWPDPGRLPNPAEILRDHTRGQEGDGTVEHMAEVLRDSYTNRMY